MIQKINFDDSRARTYRKRREVLAFSSSDSICFRKSWGEQELRAGGWVIVPLTEEDEATADVYGCDADVFAATYEPSPSLRPNRYRKKETVRAYQPGTAFEIDTVLSDGHTEVKGSRANSQDAWIVRAPGGEAYPIENAEFVRTYEEVLERTIRYRIKSRDEHWAADGTPKRVLALDGGGVRGILTLGYLEQIEELLRKRHDDWDGFRLCHYFDLIAGTSTGAIIAAGLAKGMQVAEVRQQYEDLAGSVFRRSLLRRGWLRARYNSRQLKRHLKAVFHEDTLGAPALETGLLVVAKRLDTGSIWPMSNNPRNPFYTAGPNDKFFSNKDYLLWKVIRASTAAPSYFSPERIEISDEGENPRGDFVDGGVSPHNNPALLALQLATLKGFRVNWPLDPNKLLLVSVGTGSAQPGSSKSRIAAKHAVNSLLSLMDDCAESVETMLQWLSDSPTAWSIDAAMEDLKFDLLAERPLLHYLRYNVRLERRWLMENLGRELSRRQVRKLCDLDRPKNMDLLSDIGQETARLQIEDRHFPPEFDLGE